VAARIESVDSMSAHADASEIMRWLGGFTAPPKQTFVVHGEPISQDTLGGRIQAELGWRWKAPEYRETVQL
jgi:metallo-beta-lactamase family protein